MDSPHNQNLFKTSIAQFVPQAIRQAKATLNIPYTISLYKTIIE
jgi:hypothetical protein